MNTSTVLISLSIALLAGLLLSRLAKIFQLPAVTAYLIAGILVGPFVLGKIGIEGIGFTSLEIVEHFGILCDLALGFIAFAIGNEFRVSQLKKIGKQATIIGILQAVVTTLLVDAVLIGLSFILPEGVLPLPVAIVLGAVAAATAPAATLMVVKQYKAKGPLTNILLPVVALDDAVGLVLFAISFGVARSLGSGNANILSVVLEPVLEVVLSLLLGAVLGYLFHLTERFFHSRSKRMAVSVTFVMVAVAISSIEGLHIGEVHIAFSPLLTCMMLGTVFCNVCDFSEELMDRVDRWTAPLFILFFVLSGAELDFNVFTNGWVILVGVVYILFRSIGKYVGAFGSAKLSKCEPNIVKYLGITLLPQAGVALGMASKVSSSDIPGAEIVVNITLFAVLVYEICGPFLTKLSLLKAGEINPEERNSARDAHMAKMAAESEQLTMDIPTTPDTVAPDSAETLSESN